MKTEYIYDQDPRYGWVHIDLEDHDACDIVIQHKGKSYGYVFRDGEFTPRCICHAYNEDECVCETGDWNDS